MADDTNMKTDDFDQQPTGMQEDEDISKGGQSSNPNDLGEPSYTNDEEEEELT